MSNFESDRIFWFSYLKFRKFREILESLSIAIIFSNTKHETLVINSLKKALVVIFPVIVANCWWSLDDDQLVVAD
jgi:hypothetical protein